MELLQIILTTLWHVCARAPMAAAVCKLFSTCTATVAGMLRSSSAVKPKRFPIHVDKLPAAFQLQAPVSSTENAQLMCALANWSDPKLLFYSRVLHRDGLLAVLDRPLPAHSQRTSGWLGDEEVNDLVAMCIPEARKGMGPSECLSLPSTLFEHIAAGHEHKAAQMGFISDLVDFTRSHPQMMGVQWHDALYQGRDMRTSTDSGVDAGYKAAVSGGQTGGIDWLFSSAAADWESTWRSLDPFSDWNGSVFAASIRWLAASGITKGCGNGRFCPDAKVTRGQMAAFLTRALQLPAPAQTITFGDTNGHLFEDAISRFAHAGITKGCSPTNFCPDKNVTREQMAAFLVRAGLTK